MDVRPRQASFPVNMLFIMKILTGSKSARPGALAAVAVLSFALSGAAAANSHEEIRVDLHQYGFPTANMDPYRLGIFYLSNDRVALFFEQPAADSDRESHSFQILVFNAQGQKTAETFVRGNPKAIDITTGPDGGLAVGKQGKVEFYDSNLQLSTSVPLAPATTGIAFDREHNQLIIQTLDRQLGHRSAEFLNPKSLESSASLNYPSEARAIFGKNELVYTAPGECSKSAKIVSKDRAWRFSEALPLCDSLTFIGDDELAYALESHLYIVNAAGKQVLKARIPVPNTFEGPALVGLSDDHTRLAIAALDKKPFAGGWPYYDQVFVYDLPSKRLIFRRTLPQTPRAAALSPDGHQVATIEQGALILIPVP